MAQVETLTREKSAEGQPAVKQEAAVPEAKSKRMKVLDGFVHFLMMGGWLLIPVIILTIVILLEHSSK